MLAVVKRIQGKKPTEGDIRYALWAEDRQFYRAKVLFVTGKFCCKAKLLGTICSFFLLLPTRSSKIVNFIAKMRMFSHLP